MTELPYSPYGDGLSHGQYVAEWLQAALHPPTSDVILDEPYNYSDDESSADESNDSPA